MVTITGWWPCWQEKHLSDAKRCMPEKIVGCSWTSKAATWEYSVSLLPVCHCLKVWFWPLVTLPELLIKAWDTLCSELVFSYALYDFQKTLDFYVLVCCSMTLACKVRRWGFCYTPWNRVLQKIWESGQDVLQLTDCCHSSVAVIGNIQSDARPPPCSYRPN